MPDIIANLKLLLDKSLHLQGRAEHLDPESALLGAIPELDSMSLVAIVTAIEDRFEIVFDDEDLIGENFATLAALADVIRRKGEMKAAAAVPARPLHIEGTKGKLFAVMFEPDRTQVSVAQGAAPAVLYLPPFGEEMNRSRAATAILGRALAQTGVAFLNLDLFGTGDSTGTLAQAQWRDWRDDALSAIGFLRSQGYSLLGAMGLRTGAALAVTAARDAGLSNCVLWQPAAKGRQYFTELLRSRILAGAVTGRGRETSTQLRARLLAGEAIDVLGYELSPSLAAALDEIDLTELCQSFDGRIDWLAIGSEIVDQGASAVQKSPWDDAAATAKGSLHGAMIDVPAFWLLEESPSPAALIETTAMLWRNAWRDRT